MMDLKKIKSLLFRDVELLLTNLEMEYEINGDNIYSVCPIHEGSDNKTAFSMSTEKQVWRCWTRDCQSEHGSDVFGLIQGVLSKKEGRDVSFKEALNWACKILNIDSNSIARPEKTEEPNEFVKLVGMFSEKKQKRVEETQESYNVVYPSEYFSTRGYKKETLVNFSIGDCNEKGSTMYQRAVIPIHNDDGSKIVAYIGRTTKEYRSPKFLFTKGFNKRDFLYNYHRAIDKASEKSCLFITEGQGDVWRLHESGVENVVSIFGKSLSVSQREKISKSGVTNLVILTDNDQAGRESKVQIQRQLSRMFKLRFPRLVKKDIGELSIEKIKEEILPQVEGLF
jgi:DNA primase